MDGCVDVVRSQNNIPHSQDDEEVDFLSKHQRVVVGGRYFYLVATSIFPLGEADNQQGRAFKIAQATTTEVPEET